LKKKKLKICWPNNITTIAEEGEDWFLKAQKANIDIPTGCLVGSCGACEIDVNGQTVRPCVKNIEYSNDSQLYIEFTTDPYW
tara:strand:+ start:2299 stop:2544 length:246 start_codon:yes stop_codon:yes gene_type:complete